MRESESPAALVVRTDAGEAGPAAFRAAVFLFGLAAAILVIGAAWVGLPQMSDAKSPDFNPIPPFLAVAAALLGAFFLVRAVLHTLRFRKFGISELRANEPRLGEPFEGTIRPGRDLAPLGDFTVRVHCDNTTRNRSMKSDGTNARTECLWEATVTVPAASRSSAGVPFAFDIPGNGLATGSRGDAGHVDWTLEIRAPLGGVDYFAEFPVKMRGRRKQTEGTVATKATNAVGASRQEAFAGHEKPVPQWQRIAFPALLVVGSLLAAAGLYTTAQQIGLGLSGLPATGHVVEAEKWVVRVALDGSGPPPVTARVALGSNFHRWEKAMAVRIVCRELGETPRGCRMETGGERWINTTGTLLVGLVMLALAWRLRRLRAAAAPVA